ncbi:MAG: tyrosine-type recombinase/integrase [Dehalococcoidia bacterium]|nr:tyrosine-type recombinase/integrase [Dehalococcoidia bacterium]
MRKDTLTLRALVDGFLFSLAAEGRSPRTVEYYRTLLKPFLKYAENHGWPIQADAIQKHHVGEFLDWVSTRTLEYRAGNGSRRTTTSKPVTVFNYFKAVRRLYGWAADESEVGSSPVSGIHYKTPAPTPVLPYDRDHLMKLLAVCNQDIMAGARFIGFRGKAVLLLYLDTAGRLREVESAKMSDLDLNRRMVRVVGKGGKVDELPFSAKTAKALWFYLQERQKRAKCESLFVTEEGMPFAPEGLGRWFAYLKRRAGVTCPGRIHRLRHTGAYTFLKHTRDPFLLQTFLRHKDLTMSRRYVQALRREEAVEAHRNGASPVMNLDLG